MKWPRVNPGELVHDITILSQQKASGSSGTTTKMVPFLTTRAKLKFVKGIDVIRSGQQTSQAFLTVTMIWQAGILANMQVQANGNTYVIETIDNREGRDLVLDLNCVALGLNQ